MRVRRTIDYELEVCQAILGDPQERFYVVNKLGGYYISDGERCFPLDVYKDGNYALTIVIYKGLGFARIYFTFYFTRDDFHAKILEKGLEKAAT